MRNEGKEGVERMRVRISGRVQGVFFRDSTREKAESLALAGWVRNTPGGDVEAVFEGSGKSVREMIEWCESGPPQAKVENVETSREPPENNLRGFEVR